MLLSDVTGHGIKKKSFGGHMSLSLNLSSGSGQSRPLGILCNPPEPHIPHLQNVGNDHYPVELLT